jgi:predicted amidohydrolase YtcJ
VTRLGVLSDDPFTMDQTKIKDLQIVRTVVGGSTAYHA